VVTASKDKTVRLWDVESSKQIGVFSGHEDRVNSAAFSPDGRRVVTASSDKTARSREPGVPGAADAGSRAQGRSNRGNVNKVVFLLDD
jgi:WD40 repeat protein